MEEQEKVTNFIVPPNDDTVELKMTAKGTYYWTINCKRAKGTSNGMEMIEGVDTWVARINDIDKLLRAKFPANAVADSFNKVKET